MRSFVNAQVNVDVVNDRDSASVAGIFKLVYCSLFTRMRRMWAELGCLERQVKRPFITAAGTRWSPIGITEGPTGRGFIRHWHALRHGPPALAWTS